ncbi:MAG: peptidylprolyl isomerase [Planctomycetia bacterium]|nr:peptidylprolyl isomerase [Planctomycetia bacterium]
MAALRRFFEVRWRGIGIVAAGLAVIAAALVIRYLQGDTSAQAQGPGKEGVQQTSANAPAGAAKAALKDVAVVNGQAITREQLAFECVRRFGTEVLDSLIHKYLIVDYCKRQGIEVTEQEVQAEIERLAARFKIPVDQWLKMLHEERGINPQQYADDIIWPTLALRKAAKGAMEVTPEELQAAYETQFGPAVEARIIVCDAEEDAQVVLRAALENPDDFGKLARRYSKDPGSAALDGRTMPIRKHLGDPEIEKAAFGLKQGEVSPIIKAGDQFVVLKCESHVKSRMEEVPLNGQVMQRLAQQVREKKEPHVAGKIFDELDKKAKIVRVLGSQENEARYPGVAAFVNARTVTLKELGEECIRRHGGEVLDATIARMILEQHCQKHSVKVTQRDMNDEVNRAAEAMGVVKNNQPDIKRWLEFVQEEQGLSADRYLDDVVWPTVALKKFVLTSLGDVPVSDEDLQKGFEATHGPKAECLAIVLNNARTAQEVWEKVRAKPNEVYFGQLAKQYSVEAQSSTLMGEVPPIQKHGGRPLLEREAFALKPGEISGIIQVDDKFIILYLRGFTKPANVRFEEVRDEIYKDLYEKKLRVEMAKAYDDMMSQARYDNFLSNEHHAPKAQGSAARQGGEKGFVPPATARKPGGTFQK